NQQSDENAMQPQLRSKTYTHRTPLIAPGNAMHDNMSPEAGPARRAPYYAGYQPVNGKKQLEEVIDLLYRRRWIIIACFLLIAAGTVAYTMRQVPQYSTSSIVMVNLGVPATPQMKVPGIENDLFATNTRTMAGELFIIQNSFTISQRVND